MPVTISLKPVGGDQLRHQFPFLVDDLDIASRCFRTLGNDDGMRLQSSSVEGANEVDLKLNRGDSILGDYQIYQGHGYRRIGKRWICFTIDKPPRGCSYYKESYLPA